MSDHVNRIKKAIKLSNAVRNPTGNENYDAVAKQTFEDYCRKHNIDEKMLSSLESVAHEHVFDDSFTAELFLMICIKIAEDREMLNDIDVRLDQKGGFIYKGPSFFYDEAYVSFVKHRRKYEITRESVKSKIEEDNRRPVTTKITMMNGYIHIIGNTAGQLVKYSEVAFYNAFIIKYDLLAKCVLEQIYKNREQRQNNQDGDIKSIYEMFDKEAINEQLDKT